MSNTYYPKLLASDIMVYLAIKHASERGPCSYSEVMYELKEMGFNLFDLVNPEMTTKRKKENKKSERIKTDDRAIEIIKGCVNTLEKLGHIGISHGVTDYFKITDSDLSKDLHPQIVYKLYAFVSTRSFDSKIIKLRQRAGFCDWVYRDMVYRGCLNNSTINPCIYPTPCKHYNALENFCKAEKNGRDYRTMLRKKYGVSLMD